MTAAEKELVALKRLRYQVNRFFWAGLDEERQRRAFLRLNKAWRVAEARDTARATTSDRKKT